MNLMSGIESHPSAFYWVTGATSLIMSRYENIQCSFILESGILTPDQIFKPTYDDVILSILVF